MKAISLTQPWATLLALGLKKWETRSWQPHYRGWVAIHASKGFPGWAKEIIRCPLEYPEFHTALAPLGYTDPSHLPVGQIVGVGKILRCVPTVILNHDVEYTGTISKVERAFGDYTNGRWGWQIAGARTIKPVPCRGALSLWGVPEDIATLVREAVKEAA